MNKLHALTSAPTEETPHVQDSWEVLFSQVELFTELGRGAFGKVWKGRLTKNEIVRPNVNMATPGRPRLIRKKTTVAVKMLRGEFVLCEILVS